MKPTLEILKRIRENSTNYTDEIFTRLYRYILREDIYYEAYQKLYANKGAPTKENQGLQTDQLNSAIFKSRLCRELDIQSHT